MKAMIALMAGLGVPQGPPPLTFDTPDGTYTVANASDANFTITASQPVVWTWTKSPSSVPATVTPASGGTATSITADVTTSSGGGDKSVTVIVHSNGHTWTLNLTAQDPLTI